MRKVPGYLLLAFLIAASSGCQCCDALLRLEAWKNQTLFGCFCPCLYGCGQNSCPPAPVCPPTNYAPTYSAPVVAPLTTQPIVDPSYSQSYTMPYTDCGGATVVGSPIISGPTMVDCTGATIVSSPVCQDGCAPAVTGTTVVPGPDLAPTPVPALRPLESSYAPPATR